MIDVGTAVRKAYYNALNGNVTIDGAPIPVVDEKLDLQISEHDLYMLIGAQTETQTDNKTHWVREVDLVITIINRRKATNSKTAVENIANQMFNILFPSKNEIGIVVEAPFNLSYAKVQSPGEYGFTRLESGWQISKQITFRNRITQ